MPLRDLLCILEAKEKPTKAALDQALALARGYGARATLFVAAPKVVPPYSVFESATVGGIIAGENEKVAARARALETEAKEALAKSGAAGEVEFSQVFFQDLLVRVSAHALCNDLTVLDRPDGIMERGEVLFEEILFDCGRPVLLSAPDRKPAETINKIVLAWDGSRHAARALAAALGLFAGLKEAEVVVVRGEKDLSGSAPAAQIAAHIERHGVASKITEIPVDKSGVAPTIDTYAAKAGADLIVMGGFGRSRLREFVLGGVTRQLSQTARTPLLLAH